MAIERRTLRSQVREELLERMRNGTVQPGEGINEVQLAASSASAARRCAKR